MKYRGKKHRKEQIPESLFESDETFAFIAGYTSAGFSYGITWEEMSEIEMNDVKEKEKENLEISFD